MSFLSAGRSAVRQYLDEAVDLYNRPAFIQSDPIGIPHRFSRLQDREIMGLWTAMMAWGQRATIIKSAETLIRLMDDAPYDFIVHHTEEDRVRFANFKHRTFQFTDTLYFLEFFQRYYRVHSSLETAFSRHLAPADDTVEKALIGFHQDFFNHPWAPQRTRKHIPTPERNSSCKRLNMFLRWMVRSDDRGVDFGVWRTIRPDQLLVPLDVHVERVARRLGLLERPQSDWKSVLELTAALRQFDPHDPVKYDFALFGSGVLERP